MSGKIDMNILKKKFSDKKLMSKINSLQDFDH